MISNYSPSFGRLTRNCVSSDTARHRVGAKPRRGAVSFPARPIRPQLCERFVAGGALQERLGWRGGWGPDPWCQWVALISPCSHAVRNRHSHTRDERITLCRVSRKHLLLHPSPSSRLLRVTESLSRDWAKRGWFTISVQQETCDFLHRYKCDE